MPSCYGVGTRCTFIYKQRGSNTFQIKQVPKHILWCERLMYLTEKVRGGLIRYPLHPLLLLRFLLLLVVLDDTAVAQLPLSCQRSSHTSCSFNIYGNEALVQMCLFIFCPGTFLVLVWTWFFSGFTGFNSQKRFQTLVSMPVSLNHPYFAKLTNTGRWPFCASSPNMFNQSLAAFMTIGDI